MIGQFNGTCTECRSFKPRCARVHLRFVTGPIQGKKFDWNPTVLCADCRKGVWRGKFKLAEQHRRKA